MAITLMLASAGYAYYTAHYGHENVELDESLSRSDKEMIDFLPNELGREMLKISLTTVTFCKGDYKKAAPLLEERIKEIRKANPWLTGFLAPPEEGGNIRLWYDSDPQSEHFQNAPSSFKCYEPGDVPLTQMTPFKNYDDICDSFDVKIPHVDQIVGKKVPLWKVTIIPDAAEPDEKWILVVSMCRLLGDAQTFYMLYNQMSISSKDVSSLNPKRKVEFRDEAAAHLGEEEYQYLKRLGEAKKKEKEDANGVMSIFRTQSSEKKPTEAAHELFVFRVSTAWMEREKAQHPDVTDETCLVVSWFFRKIRPEVVLLALTLREILPALNDLDAGNYQTPVPMVSEDYDVPQGIQSSLTSGKRRTHGETSLPDSPHSFGIAADWSRFGVAVEGCEETEGGDFEQTHHFPLFDTKDLLVLPKNVCGCIIFNATKGQLGALCIVPKGMTAEFQGSGIIDTTVSKLASMRYNRWLSSVRASHQSVEVDLDGVAAK